MDDINIDVFFILSIKLSIIRKWKELKIQYLKNVKNLSLNYKVNSYQAATILESWVTKNSGSKIDQYERNINYI